MDTGKQTVTGAIMVPHPPIILPGIGHGEEKRIAEIAAAYQAAADGLLAQEPETIVIISPHAPAYFDYIQVSDGPGASGDMAAFADPEDRFEIRYDQELVRRIEKICARQGLPAGTLGQQDGTLDHGTMVPLHFLKAAGSNTRFVRIGIGGPDSLMHYRVGQAVQEAARELGRKIAVVGSGDLSHCQKEDSSYGFRPEGPAYDAMIMDIMGRGDFGALLQIPEAAADKAMVCGQKPFALMAGILDGLDVKPGQPVHSAEFGVGYGVIAYTDPQPDASRHLLPAAEEAARQAYERRMASEDSYVRAARQVIEEFVTTGTARTPQLESDEKAGVFVSVHKDGSLRGCIGTTEPTTAGIAEEIRQNAVSAVSRDPRFPRVQPWELPALEISVDVLKPAEPVASEKDLDPRKYGVIVSKGGRRGLLLPDLEGVDSVKDQVRIAKQKAGLAPDEEGCDLARFEVERHR